MLNYYQRLQDLVNTNQVTIYYEISIPRSHSTVWQIAITEAPEIDGQINEPSFYFDDKPRHHNETESSKSRTFEEYCRRIVESLEGNQEKGKIGLLEKTSRRPVGLVVNDLTHSISSQELDQILHLTDKIAITIRDPRMQCYSILTRTINDALHRLGGGNIPPKTAFSLANKTEFSEKEMADLISLGTIESQRIISFMNLPSGTDVTPSILQQAIKKVIEQCTLVYLKNCWENMSHFFYSNNRTKTQCQLNNHRWYRFIKRSN